MYRSIAHPWIEYQCVGPTIRPSCNPRPSIQPHSYVSFFFLFLFSISNLQHVSKKRHCNNGGEKKKRSEKPVWISKRGGPRVSTRDRKSSNQQGILITLAPLFEFERTIDPKKREREAAGQKMCVYLSWFHTKKVSLLDVSILFEFEERPRPSEDGWIADPHVYPARSWSSH